MTTHTLQRWYVVRDTLQTVWRAVGGPRLTRRWPILAAILTSYRWLVPAYHRQRAFEREHPEMPWFAPAAILRLDEILQLDWIAFEWGSGRSTPWIARRVKFLTSIETSTEWFERIRQQPRVNYLVRFVPLDSPYAIDGLLNNSLDLIVIDGEERRACLAHALPKIKPGGWLVIDDFESLIYREIRALVCAWPGVELYSNGLMETALIRMEPYTLERWRRLLL